MGDNGPVPECTRSTDICDLRQQIDQIDDTLLELINRRLNLAKRIGKLKKESDDRVVDSTRESEILRRLTASNPGPLNPAVLQGIFIDIITAARAIQASQQVTCHDPEATVAHLAASSHRGPAAGGVSQLGIPPIDLRTRMYLVMGDPVSHSLSPAMHNAAFRWTGHNGVYLACRVTRLPEAVAGVRALSVHGCSVTLPHKVPVMELLDQVDPVARQIGAVNTIVNDDGRLIGFNSDSPGAMAALLEKSPIANRRVAVIGAGGAARAVAHGIRAHGGRLIIVNRSPDQGSLLADELGCDFCPLADFVGIEVDIVVNTTPVGMVPQTEAMPVARRCLRPGMTVMDIVYNPRETRLIKAAREAGCAVVDGVAMFVYQGAFQFERWTGTKAPVAVMRQTVLNALNSDQG